MSNHKLVQTPNVGALQSGMRNDKLGNADLRNPSELPTAHRASLLKSEAKPDRSGRWAHAARTGTSPRVVSRDGGKSVLNMVFRLEPVNQLHTPVVKMRVLTQNQKQILH